MHKHLIIFLIAVAVGIVLLLVSPPALNDDETNNGDDRNSSDEILASEDTEPVAWLITISGAISPATSDYVTRNLEDATSANARLLILAMDTPGGLDSSMREIIRAILDSPIPVVSFVSPQGARAASAGTYIMYASHIAAMSPATNLGAATPVQIGGGIGLPEPENSDGEDSAEDQSAQNTADAMKNKSINDAAAYIRSLAELRGRNIDWAEQAVRQASSLPAHQALEMNVIDLMVEDVEDLLQKIDGRQVLIQGKSIELNTASISIKQVEPDWRNRFLSTITDPNVAYILMLIGIYGLFLEFYSPGGIVPGVVGAISLLVALYAFQVLPVNYAGLALIGLGVMLMIMEAFVPSVGILGTGGVIAFVIGSVILMDTESEAFQIAILPGNFSYQR